MSIGHEYMHDGDFPAPNVPVLPASFNHWDGEIVGEDEDEGGEEVPVHRDALDYASGEMDDLELGFYLEMYEN